MKTLYGERLFSKDNIFMNVWQQNNNVAYMNETRAHCNEKLHTNFKYLSPIYNSKIKLLNHCFLPFSFHLL